MGTISLGWWAIQTSVTGNALCAILGIDYSVEKFQWAVAVIIVGLIFAIPSILGYASMKWTDYIAVPAGIILCVLGLYLAFKNFGFDTIVN